MSLCANIYGASIVKGAAMVSLFSLLARSLQM